MSKIRFFKKKISSFLPVTYDRPFEPEIQQKLLVSFALQRSGQHVVIDWICRGFHDIVHMNYCGFYRKGWHSVLTPKTGRRVIYRNGKKNDSGPQGIENYEASLPDDLPVTLFYSVEDMDLTLRKCRRLLAKYKPFTLVIIRDPANWLASSIKHGQHTQETLLRHIQILKTYLRCALDVRSGIGHVDLAIDYNKFIFERTYREKLAKTLGLRNFIEAEEALKSIPKFGGGSSFETSKENESDTLSRWTHYKDDPFFCKTLKDNELRVLSREFFDAPPGL